MLTVLGALFFLTSLGLAGAVTHGARLALLIPAVLCQLGVYVCTILGNRLKTR